MLTTSAGRKGGPILIYTRAPVLGRRAAARLWAAKSEPPAAPHTRPAMTQTLAALCGALYALYTGGGPFETAANPEPWDARRRRLGAGAWCRDEVVATARGGARRELEVERWGGAGRAPTTPEMGAFLGAGRGTVVSIALRLEGARPAAIVCARRIVGAPPGTARVVMQYAGPPHYGTPVYVARRPDGVVTTHGPEATRLAAGWCAELLRVERAARAPA